MTELDLYKFIRENNLECRWYCCRNKEPELLLWIHKYIDIEDFTKLIGYNCAADGAMEVSLLPDGEIVVDLVDICLEWWYINPLKITDEDFEYERYKKLVSEWEDGSK